MLKVNEWIVSVCAQMHVIVYMLQSEDSCGESVPASHVVKAGSLSCCVLPLCYALRADWPASLWLILSSLPSSSP